MFNRVSTCSLTNWPRLGLLLSLAFWMVAEAPKADASTELPHASVRLINGGSTDQTALAGVEIAMGPDVKTYWRMPGDSGLPPIFDWSASENLADALLQWPLPERIADPSGRIYGYHNTVIFPVRIKPKDPTKPVRLRLKLDYAVCGDVCVPMTGKAELLLDPSTQHSADIERVKAFLSRVPLPSTLGQSDRPSILSLEPQASDALRVTTTQPITDLIVEGPDGWYFGDTQAQTSTIWTVKILERPTKASLAGLAITVTLDAPTQATETALVLDASGSIR